VPTHYDVLGVDPATSPEDLRRAYVRRARALHPDRQVGADPVQAARAARAMQDVNEAWRVLRDPGTRAAYDRGLRGAPVGAAPLRPAPASGGSPVRTAPPDPAARVVRGLPWVAAAFVLGAIFVFTAFAGGASDSGPSPSDWVGKCVTGSAGSQLRDVPCDTEGASRVDLVAVRASACPSGSSATPWEGSWLCLRPVEDPPGSAG
jgi:curved DNA-binding protein CbpA